MRKTAQIGDHTLYYYAGLGGCNVRHYFSSVGSFNKGMENVKC